MPSKDVKLQAFIELQKVTKANMGFINLVIGKGKDGKKRYCYIAVHGNNMTRFEQMLNNGKGGDLKEVGAIIAAGEGEPSKEVKEYMEKIYGYDHKHSVSLISDG